MGGQYTFDADSDPLPDGSPALETAMDPLGTPPELPAECISARRGQDCCLPGQTITTGTSGADNINFGDAVARCVLGLAGTDTLRTGSATDVHLGGNGNDTIWTGFGNDAALGGDGNDTIRMYKASTSEVHDNLAHGGLGSDQIHGAGGEDTLYGNEDSDTIYGYGGKDTIIGGPGADDVKGGPSDDVFVVGSPCEVAAGDKVNGEAGTDTVRSPLSQGELVSLGMEFTSIEVFETMLPNAIGGGACYEDYHSKIRCECCNAGWGGAHCRECLDPDICGVAVTGPFAKPRRTKYWSSAIPEFAGGIYPESVPIRDTINLPAATTLPGDGNGWYFDDRMSATKHSITDAFAAGDQAPVHQGDVWTLGLQSAGAQAIGMVLDGLVLPAGAKLWTYSETDIHGPVTTAELGGSQLTVIPPLAGNTVFLEIFQPTGTSVSLDEISAAPIVNGAPPDACFEDVACVPSAWPQSGGVARIMRSNDFICSGSLINVDTDQAFFLTAEHCIARDRTHYEDYLSGSPEAGEAFDSTWMYDIDGAQHVEFRYRNTDCGSPSLDEYHESLTYFVSDILYHDHEADIAILELEGNPDPTCITYNGFDARYNLDFPPYTAGIRHPGGRPQQIDLDSDKPDTIAFFDANPAIEENFTRADLEPFWVRLLHHPDDLGWLDGGASGGPVFDHMGNVIGQLSGHDVDNSACGDWVEFYDGRLGGAYEASVDAEGALPFLLESTNRERPTWTNSDPFPLAANSDSIAPCVDTCAYYAINPVVSDEADVVWDYDAAPGQVVGTGSGVYVSPEGNDHWYALSICTQEINPGGSEPPILVRIEAGFGPDHPECATTVRDFMVTPQDC